MRLREIQKILTNNIDKLKIPDSYILSSNGYCSATNYSTFINAVGSIAITKLFDEEVAKLAKNELFIILGATTITFDSTKLNIVKSISNQIVTKAAGALALIEISFENADEASDTLAILLPEIDMSFSLLNSISKELDTLFRLMKIIPDFNHDIKVKSFDKGTNWFLVALGSDVALTLFSKLLDIVYKYRLQNHHMHVLKKQLSSLEVSQESMSEVQQALQNSQLTIYNQLSKDFLESIDLDTQNEIQSQMTKVISTINDIYDMGVSFQPSVNAIQETIKKFPDLESQKSLIDFESLKRLTFNQDE